jgi:predicted NAD/FAD-binding protein
LYEANDYIGGHTNTVEVTGPDRTWDVDTGFIVFNEVTYPNFCTIIERLGVSSQPSNMSFSVKCEKTGLEFNPNGLKTLFVQKKNLLSPSFYRMILDIFRFRRDFDRLIGTGNEEEMEIGQYLTGHGYSRRFIEQFIIPLGSSIWSSDPQKFRSFPVRTFARFFKNHGFLKIKNPFQWRVIKGGSKRYLEKLTAPYRDRIRLNCAVKGIRRHPEYVEIKQINGDTEQYDQVIIATHSDQALDLLEDASDAEKKILGTIQYQANQTVLHTDSSILPANQSIWASWNYVIPPEETDRVAITYDMNILQTLDAADEYCVTLNNKQNIDRSKIIGEYDYHHPVYTIEALQVQNRFEEISGINRTHYCGAYWGYGFHEDGVNSALAACKFFGKTL